MPILKSFKIAQQDMTYWITDENGENLLKLSGNRIIVKRTSFDDLSAEEFSTGDLSPYKDVQAFPLELMYEFGSNEKFAIKIGCYRIPVIIEEGRVEEYDTHFGLIGIGTADISDIGGDGKARLLVYYDLPIDPGASIVLAMVPHNSGFPPNVLIVYSLVSSGSYQKKIRHFKLPVSGYDPNCS